MAVSTATTCFAVLVGLPLLPVRVAFRPRLDTADTLSSRISELLESVSTVSETPDWYIRDVDEPMQDDAVNGTRNFARNDPCNDTFFAVLTSVHHWRERDAIRETWMSRFSACGAAYRFFLGREDLATDDMIALAEEQRVHRDLVLIPIRDSYANLTRKTEGAARWAQAHVQPSYFVKVDDDVYVSADAFSTVLRQLPRANVYMGRLRHKALVHHNKHHKWAVPKRLYSQRYFPDYAEGPLYVLSGDAMRVVARGFRADQSQDDVFPLEDVNTALLLRGAGIHPMTLARDGKTFTHSSRRAGTHRFLLSHHDAKPWVWKAAHCPSSFLAVHAVDAHRMRKTFDAEFKHGPAALRDEFCPEHVQEIK